MPALVLSFTSDVHVELVVTRMADQPFVLVADVPFTLRCLDDDVLQIKQLERTAVVTPDWQVWNRRPFPVPGGETEVQEFCRVELRSCVMQCLQLVVPMENWVNWPEANERASDKLLVSRLAAHVGLQTPRTSVTSEIADLESRYGDDDFVVKPTRLTYRIGELVPAVGFARRTNVRHLRSVLGDHSMLPVMAQDLVRKRADWRVTWVDGRHQAARMTGTPDELLDFRRCYEMLHYEEVQLPARESRALAELMQRLDLRYGACDFVEDASGSLHFLEVNAMGQFAWLERTLGETPLGPCDATSLLADALGG